MTWIRKLSNKIISFGPALFIIGYVVGTGSITSMIVAGAKYGMSLTWALLLSCFFTYIFLKAISKLTIITGETLMFLFRKHFGSIPTLFIMFGLATSIISSVIGVMGIVVEAFSAWLSNSMPGMLEISPILVALTFILLLIGLILFGKYNSFIKVMAFFVFMMTISFLITSVFVIQSPALIIKSFSAEVMNEENAGLVFAGMVGTTMAAVVLVSRSILVKEQGWKLKDLKIQNKDARLSMTLTFIVCAAIMICSVGTLYAQGLEVNNVIDMVVALGPWAGKFTMTLFAIGILGAGLSSIFPNLLLLPWLIADYTNKERNLKSPWAKTLIVIVGLTGLIIPIFGGKPVWILITSQALSPFIMPLITIFLLVIMNNKKVMKEHLNSKLMNISLGAALIFNCYMLFVSLKAFTNF